MATLNELFGVKKKSTQTNNVKEAPVFGPKRPPRGDVISQTPEKGVFGQLKDFLKPRGAIAPRLAESIKSGTKEIIRGGAGIVSEITGREITPQNDLERFFFGSKDNEPAEPTSEIGTEFLTGIGVGKESAEKFGLPTGLALLTIDLLPPGPGKAAREGLEFIVKRLAKLNKAEDIAKVLKTELKLPDNLIKQMADDIAVTQDPKTINSILRIRSSKAPSVATYIDESGEKVGTILTRKEYDKLFDEIRVIGTAKKGKSQLHLDAIPTDAGKGASQLEKGVKIVDRTTFLKGNAEATKAFSFIEAELAKPIAGLPGKTGLKKVGLAPEAAPKVTKGEDVLLKTKLKTESRAAKNAVQSFKREQKRLTRLEKQLAEEISKPKGAVRRKINFSKLLGEFNQTALSDAKKAVGVTDSLKKADLEDLQKVAVELKKRLAFKFQRGFRPSGATKEKLRIADKSGGTPDIAPQDYARNAEIAEKGGKISARIKDVRAETRLQADKTLGAISSRMADIDPKLRVDIRRFIFKSNSKVLADKDAVVPFFEKGIKKMSKPDFSDFDFAAKNGDAKKIKQLADKYGFADELADTKATLDDIYERANDVGFDVGYRQNFFPRIVKDSEGLVSHFSKTDEGTRSIIRQAIGQKELALGREMTVNEKATLINNMIRGYRGGQITLSPIGNMKNRVIDYVTPELNQFYYPTDVALVKYIESMNNAIEARRFFGKSRLVDKKTDAFNNLDDSIGAYMLDLMAKGKITAKQELELREIFNAFFGEKGTSGLVNGYKNLTYINVMGSPFNAITQIGDLAFPVYNVLKGRATFFETGSALVRSTFNKSKITKEDIGIRKIAQEFESTSKSANAVDKVFKLVGLTKVDSVGKETLINPIIAKFQTLAKTGGKNSAEEAAFIKEMKLIFEDDALKVIGDLKTGNISDDVKFLAFYKLLDFQPVAKSEVPQRYLTGGNARILYMLKTWTLKMFDVYRNEVFRTMKTDKVEGVKNMIYLTGALMTMNATADEIKDFMLGRESSFKDTTIDNIAKLVGFSRYSVDQISRDGLGQVLKNLVAPPTPLVDNISRDVEKIYKDWGEDVEVNKLRTIQDIPLAGKLYYWWFGRGSDFKNNDKDTGLGFPAIPQLPKLPEVELPELPKL